MGIALQRVGDLLGSVLARAGQLLEIVANYIEKLVIVRIQTESQGFVQPGMSQNKFGCI